MAQHHQQTVSRTERKPAPRAVSAPVFRHLAAAILGLAALAYRPAHAAAANLPPAVERILARAEFATATWALCAADATSGRMLFATNEHRLLKPASNAKLFTGALALHVLGPDYRIRTRLEPRGPLRFDTLDGDLLVRGRGDFSFAARFQGNDPERALEPLVQAVLRAGVRRIRGGIVADDSWLPGPHLGHGWAWEDLQTYYGAAGSALMADDNVVDLVFHPSPIPGGPVRLEASPGHRELDIDLSGLRTGPTNGPRQIRIERGPGSSRVTCSGSLPAGGAPGKDAVSLPEPTLHFARRLTEALTARGIVVEHSPRRARADDLSMNRREPRNTRTTRKKAEPTEPARGGSSSTIDAGSWSLGSSDRNTRLSMNRRRMGNESGDLEGAGETPALPGAWPVSSSERKRRHSSPHASASSHPTLEVESPPLSELLARMMKPSQNLYAQMLLIQAGRGRDGSRPDSPSGGEVEALTALRAFTDEAGIPSAEMRLDDGAGLSRSALVSANAIVRLLRYMDGHRHREAFLEALPVAGVDGTLRQRFRGTPAQGNLRAKTGTLRYVHTLSGFMTNVSGRRLVFSAMLNAYEPTGAAEPTGRAALDELVQALIQTPTATEP